MTLLNDLTFTALINRLIALLVVIGFYGWVLGLVARAFGSKGASYEGRFSANPFAHISVPGLISGLLFRWAWTRPIDLRVNETRGGRIGVIAVVVGASAIMLAIVYLLGYVRPMIIGSLPRSAGLMAAGVVVEVQNLAVRLAVISVLPLPVVPGFSILAAVVPAAERLKSYDMMLGFCLLLVIGIAETFGVLTGVGDLLASWLIA